MPRVDRTPIPKPAEYFEDTPLYYPISDILYQFKTAKDKKFQLSVLAQMNLCKKKDIKHLLTYYGLIKTRHRKVVGG